VAHGKVGNQVGVVNVAAGPVMGVQVGVINIAEDVVAPIGLLSFSRTGYHGLELAYDEQQVMSAALKTGGRLIFNRVGAGIKQEGDELWPISTLGIGAHMGGARLFTDVELVASSALKLGEFQGDHLLSELRTTVGYRFFPHFSVVAGPSLSVMTTFDDRGSPFAPAYVLYAYQGESVRVDVWPGVHVGLQF
jgi:hypothetical protein